MKKHYFFTLLLTICFSALSFGQVILAEDFSYTDGSLVGNSTWATESGTPGDFLISSGKAVIQHGTPSEDVKFAFDSGAGDVYVGFDFSVDDLGAPYSGGSDYEYFAHIDFKARLDVQAGANGGDFTVGISSGGSTAEANWSADLTFGDTYRVILKFDQVTGLAQLWINPSASSDTSISGTESGAATVENFDLRQSDSSENETVRLDDLMIGKTFNDVLVFEAATASVKNNAIKGFATYPNPVTNKEFRISSSSNSVKQIAIFNVIGKKVLTARFSGFKSTIDVSAIGSGIYILKVMEAGKISTKKLVIR
ncbi:MAG: hypothetical protein ACI9JT_001004 [Polaribacter sp.]|jgi:hypothetical protein